jgi:plastocyanin
LLFRSIDFYIHRMKFWTLLVVPFVALSLVGCSSGSSGGAATVPAGATLITAIEGIAWDAKTYAATAVDGKVTIALENDSSLPHDLHLIDAENVDVGIALEVAGRGGTDTKTSTLAVGTYQVICTITGHGNMKATLTVS